MGYTTFSFPLPWYPAVFPKWLHHQPGSQSEDDKQQSPQLTQIRQQA